MKGRNVEISYFVCPECGGSFPLPRRKNKRRKGKHIKDLWCPFCKKIVKTTEVRPIDYYEFEALC